jgi:CRISPR-associated protein Cmr1
MDTLAATFRVITPVFCAGHEQNGPSHIRAFSLRGAIRYWHRAVDPLFRKHEGPAFGSSAGDQGEASPIVLIVSTPCQGSEDFSRVLKAGKRESGGAAYLGYSLYIGKNKRKGIAPGREFGIEVVPRLAALPAGKEKKDVAERKKSELEKARKCWAAGIWLLGHLGGIGSRSRRGIGTIALEHWNGWKDVCSELPLAHKANNPKDWKTMLRQGLETIKGWFSGRWDPSHEHQIIEDLEKSVALVQRGCRSWQDAMETAGDLYKDFRRGKPLEKRASFGLPLPKHKNGRAASRLHIRILELGRSFHPLFVAMQGPVADTDTLKKNRLRELGTDDPQLHMKFIAELKQKHGGL